MALPSLRNDANQIYRDVQSRLQLLDPIAFYLR